MVPDYRAKNQEAYDFSREHWDMDSGCTPRRFVELTSGSEAADILSEPFDYPPTSQEMVDRLRRSMEAAKRFHEASGVDRTRVVM